MGSTAMAEWISFFNGLCAPLGLNGSRSYKSLSQRNRRRRLVDCQEGRGKAAGGLFVREGRELSNVRVAMIAYPYKPLRPSGSVAHRLGICSTR